MPGAQNDGVVKTVSSDYKSGSISQDDGGPDLDFDNPAQFPVTIGDGVIYIEVTNRGTSFDKAIITGRK